MLLDFFYTLRSAKLPVSVKEYLTLLEALKKGVVGPNADAAAADTFGEAYSSGYKIFITVSLFTLNFALCAPCPHQVHANLGLIDLI